MEQGEKDFGILNSMQKIHKKIVGNEFVSEFDVFSVPVKLTMKGNDVYQTCCGGFIHIVILLMCIGLTVLIMFPGGVQLDSYIDLTVIPSDVDDGDQTLFDHTDQLIGIKGYKKVSSTVSQYESIAAYASIYAYQIDTADNTATPLDISKSCTGGYEFCFKKTDKNKAATL